MGRIMHKQSPVPAELPIAYGGPIKLIDPEPH